MFYRNMMEASAIATLINFPLWRAGEIGLSGFKIEGSSFMVRYYNAVMTPPYRGVVGTLLGMTWARAAVLCGSEIGKENMIRLGYYGPLAQTMPPLVIGTLVQVINMPLVRAAVTIQDPSSHLTTVTEALIYIYKHKGISGLWHGVSAGVMKTVPKFGLAIAVKDYMEEHLPRVEKEGDKRGIMIRSAVKSVAAGIAGAVVTNPIGVLRNEMFKTNMGLVNTLKKLLREEGWAFGVRGMASNMLSAAFPIAVTIFTTDLLLSMRKR